MRTNHKNGGGALHPPPNKKFTPNGVRRNRIMDDFMNTVTEKIVPEAIRLIIVIVLAALCFFLIKRFTKFIARPAHLSKLSPSVKTFLVSFLSIALKTLTVITGASMLGVPMASVVAVIGSAGLAFGLALQGGLSNIAGGFMILIFKPFSVGHYIEAGSFAGTVTDIGVFYTTLITYDNVRVVIPNSTVTSGTVVNYSSEEKRREELISISRRHIRQMWKRRNARFSRRLIQRGRYFRSRAPRS